MRKHVSFTELRFDDQNCLQICITWKFQSLNTCGEWDLIATKGSLCRLGSEGQIPINEVTPYFQEIRLASDENVLSEVVGPEIFDGFLLNADHCSRNSCLR
jgi:hypothetical protein